MNLKLFRFQRTYPEIFNGISFASHASLEYILGFVQSPIKSLVKIMYRHISAIHLIFSQPIRLIYCYVEKYSHLFKLVLQHEISRQYDDFILFILMSGSIALYCFSYYVFVTKLKVENKVERN